MAAKTSPRRAPIIGNGDDSVLFEVNRIENTEHGRLGMHVTWGVFIRREWAEAPERDLLREGPRAGYVDDELESDPIRIAEAATRDDAIALAQRVLEEWRRRVAALVR